MRNFHKAYPQVRCPPPRQHAPGPSQTEPSRARKLLPLGYARNPRRKPKQSLDSEKEKTCVYPPAVRPEELLVSCPRVQMKFGGGPVPIQLDSSGSVVFLRSVESGGDPRLLLCSSSVYYRD
ncbi:unnamed protein product [Pleuronectes platessa]|uniref:Uncharacterized protein n=1 Tax=Pleuronectes platessa TaxID=8262 RepID=A0A9N7VEN5_PLEPL|nr:unnamed protein product [Pleuronectes platessa]